MIQCISLIQIGYKIVIKPESTAICFSVIFILEVLLFLNSLKILPLYFFAFKTHCLSLPLGAQGFPAFCP